MGAHQRQRELETVDFSSTVKLFKTPEGLVFGAGTTVPVDATAGWAPGALFIHTSGSGIDALLYINIGSKSSSNFDALDLTAA